MLAARSLRLHRPLTDHELEDLVQDTLVSIWRRLPTYAGQATLETWAFRFCQNQLSNHLRSRGRGKAAALRLSCDPTGATEECDDVDHERVYQALDRLHPTDGLIVRARHFDALGFEELARTVRLSPSRVKARYYGAMARLREMLCPVEEEVER